MPWIRSDRTRGTRIDCEHHQTARSYLVSSSFHDPFSKGNIAYGDVIKVGHENYRAGLLDQMERGGASAEEQRARLPTEDLS